MTIQDIEIPDSEIEKLSGTKQRILYLLYEAHPIPVGIGDLLRAGGSGCQTRRKKLNEEFLVDYGLVISAKCGFTSVRGTKIWEYALKRTQPRLDEKGNFILPLPAKPEIDPLAHENGAK